MRFSSVGAKCLGMYAQLLSRWPWGGLVIVATWVAAFAAGFPLAHVDDFYFVGPAMNLAKGGVCANPWCPGIGLIDPDYTKEFFVYVPLHAHVLAAWIALVGVSTASFTLFQCLAGGLATWGLERLMRPALSGAGWCLVLSLCVVLYLATCGLRPDALGLALLCWGAGILRPSISFFAWSMSCLSLFLTCITSPNLGILAPLILTVALISSFRMESRSVLIWRFALATGAGLVTTLLFLYLIDFQLAHFLDIFNKTRILGAQAGTTMHNYFVYSLQHGPKYMFRFAVLGVIPYIALFTMLGLAYGCRKLFVSVPSGLELLLIGLAGLVMLMPANSSGTGFVMPSFYCLVACLYFVALLKSRQLLFYAGYALFFVLVVRANGNYVAGFISGRIVPIVNKPDVLKAELKRTTYRHVYLDSFALRAVFDYKVPPDGLDYNFGDMVSFQSPHSLVDYPSDSMVIASPPSVQHAPRTKLTHVPVVGFLLPDVPGNPYDCIVARGGEGPLVKP